MAPALSCKTCKNSQHAETRGKTNEIKSKLACFLEVDAYSPVADATAKFPGIF